MRPAHRHDRNSILGRWAGSHIRTRDRTGAANGHVTEPMPIFQIWEPRAGDARRRHRVQGGAKPPAHGMWEHSGQLRVLLQRPAQASALSAPAGARGASRDAPRRDDDRTRVEAGSITFLIRFSIIIFSILKSIFMRTLNRRARRALVRGAEWRLPPATDIRGLAALPAVLVYSPRGTRAARRDAHAPHHSPAA